MPNRHGNSPAYRYGFQGQEKDDELKGEGNSYDFGARMFDPRVGRWFARDKVVKSDLSNYQFASNNPIIMIDYDGDDEYYFTSNWEIKYKKAQFRILQNGDIKHYLPIEDTRIKKPGANSYYMKLPNGNDVKVFSPFTIKGGDGNRTGKLGNEWNNITTLAKSTDYFLKSGGLDKYIKENKSWGLATFGYGSQDQGKWDFKFQLKELRGSNRETTLYDIDGTYYNRNEAGNFYWGYAAAAHGFDLETMREHVNDHYGKNDGGQDTDEPWEEQAWTKGYYYYMMTKSTNEKDKKTFTNLYKNLSEDYNDNSEKATEKNVIYPEHHEFKK